MVYELATAGETAWHMVNFPSFVSSIYTKGPVSKEINNLRWRIAEQLKKICNAKYRDRGPLGKQEICEALKDFCEVASSQLESIPPDRTDINLKDIVGLPIRETTAEEKTLRDKLSSTCDTSAKIDMIMISPGFFAGAVGAGYLTDYLTGSKTITYIATPIGAILGAVIVYGLTYLASLPFINHFGNKLKNETNSKDNLFMQHIGEYIYQAENTQKV